jgi:hypothetical protein
LDVRLLIAIGEVKSAGERAVNAPYVEPPFVERRYSMLLGVSPEGAVKDTDTEVSATIVAIFVGGFKTIPLDSPNFLAEPALKELNMGMLLNLYFMQI